MQNTEASCEENERVIKKFKTGRSSLPSLVSYETLNEPETSRSEFCLFSKLLEIHHEECSRNTEEPKNGLKYNSFLLEKLVIKERLSTLILNLYPGNKGFSMAFRTIPRSELGSDDTANIIETTQWPYEDDDILRHIDNEELPPTLVDVFELHYSHLFYSGCIIAEIRDYRQAYPHSNCDIHHVLLRPTLKSIMSDINNIVETNNSASEEKDEWSVEERHMLESQILLADNPHICLDPDNTISLSQLRLNQSRNMWNMHKFHRMARKFSQVTVNRKRKLDQFTHKAGLELYDYINRVRTKLKSPSSSSKLRKSEIQEVKPIPVPNLDSPAIGPPSQGVVINEFKAYQPPVESNDYLPQIVEEYVLETKLPPKDKNKQRVYHIKLSILQRPSNSEYLGELYLDRDHKENERNGVACRFTLGTRMHVNKYLQQFSETFTKSGRQSVVMRRGGRNTNFKISLGQLQQNAAQSSAQQKQQQQSVNQPQQQNQQLGTLPNHVINGIVSGGVNIVQNQVHTSTSSTPVLQSHLQSSSTVTKPSTHTLTNQQLEINALAIKLMNFGQEFQAAAHAKQQEQQRQLQQQQQQQQQQKATTNANNTIINLLNSGPASNINSEANAVVVNAINNSSLLSQQIQSNSQQKLLTPRKMTVMNLPSNARVIGHAGNLVMNNNRLAELNNLNSGQQTITLTSVNSNESFSYTAVPVKQQVINQRVVSTSNEPNKQTALSALLVGTPAADRPDIVSSNANSLLLEKLASSSSSNSSQGTSQSFLQNPNKPQQFVVQSPKINTVQSPMSSPQQTTNTINVQSLKLSQLQSLTGLHNVQVQLPGFSQPISLSSAGSLQGHPTGLLVSVPVTSSSATSTISQSNNGTGVVNTGPTVVLANAAGLSSLAQLVSGMKNLNQQGIRQGVPATVSLSQGQPFQLITSLQGQRLQQANLQQNLTARTIQRTPITIKMATTSPNTNTSQVTINTNTLNQQLQKQVQLQQYQQLCLNQQQNVASVGGKLRRRSNTSTDPQ